MSMRFLDKARAFAALLAERPRLRHAFFFAAALLVVTLYGYYFGTFDQASHIPFLKKTLNPSLFPGDIFFNLRNTHYSYFWLFFLPFLRIGLLEWVMFVVHIAATYLTFWALWKLSMTLFADPLAATVTVAVFVFPHIGFSGFPLFEFSMLNRTVCLPFELFAMNWYLQKKQVRAFFLLGLLYNLHALSVHFFAFMLMFDLGMRLKRTGPGIMVRSLVVFIAGALPVLVWKFGHSGVAIVPNVRWFDILNRGVFFHLFNFFSLRNPFVLPLTLSGIVGVIVFYQVAQRLRNYPHTVTRNWMMAGILVCVVQFIATYVFPAPILIQSQILRIGIVMMLITYLYLAEYVATEAHKNPGYFTYLFVALLLSASPILFFVALAGYAKKIRFVTRFWNAFMIAVFVVTLIVIYLLNLWSPGFFIFPKLTPFAKAQLWAKRNTPKNALFITPPDIWWMYETEWRVLSERSTVSTLSELLEAAFDPSYITYWKPRFEDLAPGALEKFDGNFFENKQRTYRAFYGNSGSRFAQLARKYQADYLVTDTKHRYSFPIAYLNEGYIIYKLHK